MGDAGDGDEQRGDDFWLGRRKPDVSRLIDRVDHKILERAEQVLGPSTTPFEPIALSKPSRARRGRRRPGRISGQPEPPKLDVMKELVRSVKKQRWIREQTSEIEKEINQDMDRFGKRNSIAARVQDEREGVRYATVKSQSPRFASADSVLAHAWAAPHYVSGTRNLEPGQYDVRVDHRGQMLATDHSTAPAMHKHSRVPKVSPWKKPTAGSGTVAFSRQSPRFPPTKIAAPEPAVKAIKGSTLSPHGRSMSKKERFNGAFGSTSENSVDPSTGILDQMYDVDRSFALGRTVSSSPRRYAVMRSSEPRFSTARARALNATNAPFIREEVSDIGPGRYDPPLAGIRVKSRMRQSAAFLSRDARFAGDPPFGWDEW